MPHAWILEVLQDIAEYADKNRLFSTLGQMRNLMELVKIEIAEAPNGVNSLQSESQLGLRPEGVAQASSLRCD